MSSLSNPLGDPLAGAVSILYAALLAAGALYDIRHYIIPNLVSLALAGLFALTALAGAVDWWPHVGTAAAVLAGGVGLLYLGKIGGGDAKFLSAAALWAGPHGVLELLVNVALAGGVLALVLIALRRAVAAGWTGGGWGPVPRLLRPGEAVPYGVAIAAGAALEGLGPFNPALNL